MKRSSQTITVQWKWIALTAIALLVILWVRRRKEQEATANIGKPQARTIVYNMVSGGGGGTTGANFTEYFNSVAGGTSALYTTGTITEIVEIIRNGRLMQNNEYSFSGSMITLSIATGSSVGASGLESFIVKYN